MNEEELKKEKERLTTIESLIDAIRERLVKSKDFEIDMSREFALPGPKDPTGDPTFTDKTTIYIVLKGERDEPESTRPDYWDPLRLEE